METRKPYGLRSSKRSSLPAHAHDEVQPTSRKRRRTDSSFVDVKKPEAKVPRIEAKSRKEIAKKKGSNTETKGNNEIKVIEPSRDSVEESHKDASDPATTIQTEPVSQEPVAAKSEPPREAVSQGITVDSVLSAIPSKSISQSTAPQTPIISVEESLTNGATAHTVSNPSAFEWSDLNVQLRTQNLPILENLAEQILTILSKGSYQDALQISAQPNTEHGQAYATIKSLFEQTRKIYSPEDPFILADDLNLQGLDSRKAIRKSNLATFVAIAFGGSDGGFYHLNEYFMETIVPDGGKLLKQQGKLFLDLKTQAYISAVTKSDRNRPHEKILEDVFPSDLAQKISRPSKTLTNLENEFLSRAQSRRQHLAQLGGGKDAIASLPQKYVWEEFLRDLSTYLNRNFHELVGQPTYKTTQPRNFNNLTPFQSVLQEEAKNQQAAYQANATTGQGDSYEVADLEEKSLRAAQLAMSHWESNNATIKNGESDQNNEKDQSSSALIASSYGGIPEIPYHTQSAPTQVLYERARLAATAKQSPNNRRAGLPSQRRPWTTEEENALMAGLDRVKGPHWSQILAMFGPGGTINESLKDRNQVQLKDKARNLKLFFLKSGIEVPYYLQFVTGELKTRAPGQAAKNEAKERERMNIDEDKAHVEGVLALANGGRAGSSDTIDEGHEQEMDIDQKVLEQLPNA